MSLHVTGIQYNKDSFTDGIPVASTYKKVVTPRYALPHPLHSMSLFKENVPHWFPMRVRNSSVSRLKLMTERLNGQQDYPVETYVPFSYIKVSKEKMDFAPFLLNYIFVRATFADLVKVKSNQELFEPLRFVMHPAFDDNLDVHDEVLYLPDKQMQDYIRVTEQASDKVIFLNNMDYVCRPSQEVQITQGPFAGVVGRIKRVGGNRCVVLPIGNEMAVGVLDIPRAFLRYLTPDDALPAPNV